MALSGALDAADQATLAHSGSLIPENMILESSPLLAGSATFAELAQADEAHSSSGVISRYDSRTLDVIAATLLLILVLPLMALCAIAVLLTSGGPILFRHPRIGRNGEVFDCLKFRTMIRDADKAIEDVLNRSPQNREQWKALQKLKKDPRTTPLGALLRRYCLDELPQLFNILAGQMSMVGPRPIIATEIERYGANFALYCSVKPGLTGLWQVSGRHRLSYSERVELDASYVRSRTLALDLLILWKTGPVVLCAQNE
jgi:exopolysaccharide production protein ExoY